MTDNNDFEHIWDDSSWNVDDDSLTSTSVNSLKTTSTFKNTLKSNKGNLRQKDRESLLECFHSKLNLKKLSKSWFGAISAIANVDNQPKAIAGIVKKRTPKIKLGYLKNPEALNLKRACLSVNANFKRMSSREILRDLLN